MEVIGIPLPQPGFYVVELASPRLGKRAPRRGEALLRRHQRAGDEPGRASQARARKLAGLGDHARPRQARGGAQVTVRDCSGKLWFEGTTGADGIVRTDDKLPPPARDPTVQGRLSPRPRRLRALGEDLSFTYSDWNDGIRPWNFNLRTESSRAQPLSIHTVFDRTLFRAGETVSMKHIARAPSGTGFAIPELRRTARRCRDRARWKRPEGASCARSSTRRVSPRARGRYRPKRSWAIYRLNWTAREIQSDARVPGRGVPRAAHARRALAAERAARRARVGASSMPR